MELGFADPWDSTKRFEGFQNIPPKCLKQYSDSGAWPLAPKTGNGDSSKAVF